LDIHRRVPTFAPRLSRRSALCHLTLLAWLDCLTQCALDRSDVGRRTVRRRLHAHIHGFTELYYGRIRGIRRQRYVSHKLLQKHFRCTLADRCSTDVQQDGYTLGHQSSGLSEPRNVRHPLCFYKIRRPNTSEQQVLPGAKGEETAG